jgi:hypothetical protein
MENEIMRNWLLMLALVFGATNANAELVLKDFLPGSGDKMIMYDTSTKLEWLRLTATAGMSFDDVRKSRWIHLYGFRIATYPEFQSLFTNFGLAEQQSQDYQQVSHALHLATLLGPTIYGDGRISAYGMTATNFISGSYIPPIGMEFTPVTGKVDLLVGIDTHRNYLYDSTTPGSVVVERMKALAVQGHGLNAYISSVVKGRYARKW